MLGASKRYDLKAQVVCGGDGRRAAEHGDVGLFGFEIVRRHALQIRNADAQYLAAEFTAPLGGAAVVCREEGANGLTGRGVRAVNAADDSEDGFFQRGVTVAGAQ